MAKRKKRRGAPRRVPENVTVSGVTKTIVDDDFMGDVFSHEETRYVILDADTGEVFDDAQGWGYKTKRNAYAALGHMRARAEGKPTRSQLAKSWLNSNPAAKAAIESYVDRNFKHIADLPADTALEEALAGVEHGKLPDGVTPAVLLRNLG